MISPWASELMTGTCQGNGGPGQEAGACSLPQTQHGADDLDLAKAHASLDDIFLGTDLELQL